MSSSEPCKTETMSSSVPGKMQKEKVGETKPILSQLREDGNQSVKTNSYFGSNTSINSIWTEDGRLITPPPRRKSLSRQNLSKTDNLDAELDRNCSSSSSWRNNSWKHSTLATA